jgi:hypothetical protein
MSYVNYQHKINDKGDYFDCDFYYEPVEKATADDPPSHGSWILVSVKLRGVDLFEHLSYTTLRDIEESSQITFEMMGE